MAINTFEQLLNELELHPVSGMHWLERNGYSQKENQSLIRRQPFLPYSLILPRAEIRKLEQQKREVYTSFPIPLIPREALEEALVEKTGAVLHLSEVTFYLWFNENLLDEEALRNLIAAKEAELKKKQEQVENRQKEYADYIEKRNCLAKQIVTKELLEQNQQSQTETKERIKSLEETIEAMEQKKRELEQLGKELQKTIQKEKQDMDWCKRREEEFQRFCEAYEAYTGQQKEESLIIKEENRVQEAKKRAQESRELLEERLKSLEIKLQEIEAVRVELQRKCVKYALNLKN